MTALLQEIRTVFGLGKPPEGRALVLWDGFDELEKESAVRFYSGKHWVEVLAWLHGRRNDPGGFGAHAYLEEWSVLTPQGITYYARAYLEYLLESASSAESYEEFIFYFLGQLYHLLHAIQPFNTHQTDILRRVVTWIHERAAEPAVFEYFGHDIRQTAERILAEIAAQGG